LDSALLYVHTATVVGHSAAKYSSKQTVSIIPDSHYAAGRK